MNFCQEHWDLLRSAIECSGLLSLVADNGAELAARMAEQLESGETTLTNYDPLMSAMFALTNFAYETVGPSNAQICLLHTKCPICMANEVHKMSCTSEGCEFKVEQFFSNAVDDEVERAKVLLGGGS